MNQVAGVQDRIRQKTGMYVLGMKMLSFVEISQGNRNLPVEAADNSPASEGQTRALAGGIGQGMNEF